MGPRAIYYFIPKKTSAALVVAIALVLIIAGGSVVFLLTQTGKDATITVEYTNKWSIPVTFSTGWEGYTAGTETVQPGETVYIRGVYDFSLFQTHKEIWVWGYENLDFMAPTLIPQLTYVHSGDNVMVSMN